MNNKFEVFVVNPENRESSWNVDIISTFSGTGGVNSAIQAGIEFKNACLDYPHSRVVLEVDGVEVLRD